MRTAALGAIAMMCVGAALAQVPAGVDLATMQGWDIVLAEDAIKAALADYQKKADGILTDAK